MYLTKNVFQQLLKLYAEFYSCLKFNRKLLPYVFLFFKVFITNIFWFFVCLVMTVIAIIVSPLIIFSDVISKKEIEKKSQGKKKFIN